jgi:hypothetical protein
MVVNALGPAVLALLALILLAGGMAEPGLWRLCSGIYLAGGAFFGWASIREQRRLSESGQLLFTGALGNAIWAGSFAAHAVELVNLIGFPLGPSLAVFLFGLWILLAVAALQFVALLFSVLR